MFREIEGDLFNGPWDAIGHGVNCHGVMGAGIAKTFKEKFPLMYEEYAAMCKARDFHLNDVFKYYVGNGRWIYNMATQTAPGPNARLSAVTDTLHTALVHATRYGVKELALPLIGCGIGGLDYEDVQRVCIQASESWTKVDLTVVHWKP